LDKRHNEATEKTTMRGHQQRTDECRIADFRPPAGRRQLTRVHNPVTGESFMTALIALTATGVFAAGVVAGIIGVVTAAIRWEERNRTLTSGPTGYLTVAGRWPNGVCVRTPRTPAADRTTALV
jgi:hypothetical protein